jgi:hypothetical protein
MIGREVVESASLALLSGYRREGCHQLVHALAAASGTLDFGFLDVGDVEALGELLVAVLTVVEVLRHNATPAIMIPPLAVEGLIKSGELLGLLRGIERR